MRAGAPADVPCEAALKAFATKPTIDEDEGQGLGELSSDKLPSQGTQIIKARTNTASTWYTAGVRRTTQSCLRGL